VPKQVLVSNLDALMHTEQLFFSKKLRESPALEQELKDFRRHVSEAGRYSFAAREGQHDDLVLAVAIALWRAVKRKKSFGDDRSPPKVHHGYEHSKPHLHRRRRPCIYYEIAPERWGEQRGKQTAHCAARPWRDEAPCQRSAQQVGLQPDFPHSKSVTVAR
jgi:hypothetical protein